MRTMILAALMVCACGQGGAPAQAQNGATNAAQAGAEPAGAVETQAQYVARCTREMIATNPESQRWAQGACEQNWEKVVAAGPLADVILAEAPATAAAANLNVVSERLPQIRARLGRGFDVRLARSQVSMTFNWNADGDIVPYDVVDALKARHATLTLAACQSYGGVTDVVRIFNVVAAARAPFALSVYGHDAAVAGAYAVYNVGLDLSGRPASLARVREAAPNEEWAARCPE